MWKILLVFGVEKNTIICFRNLLTFRLNYFNIINSIFQDEMTFNIGIGFNLANSEPTLSFNDLLKKQGLAPLDPETK